jgi:hypothetical protein
MGVAKAPLCNYNEERLHQALDYRTPAAVYQGMRERRLATSEGKEVQRSPQT